MYNPELMRHPDRDSGFSVGSRQDQVLGVVQGLHYTDPNPGKSLAIEISPALGSNIFSFSVGGKEIVSCNKTALVEQAAQGAFTGIFVLGPFWPGREPGAMGRFNGKLLDARDIPTPSDDENLVHGFARFQTWHFTQPMAGSYSARLITAVRYTTRDTKHPSSIEKAYPYNVLHIHEHILERDGLTIVATFKNKGNTQAPIAHALHTDLSTSLSLPEKTTILVPARSYVPLDDKLLPEVPVNPKSVAGTKYDLNRPKLVSDLRLDDYLTDLDPSQPAIYDPIEEGFRVLISASKHYKHCVVFTGNQDGPHGYVAIERQTNMAAALSLHGDHPDLANIISLAPGQRIQMWTKYQIEHKTNPHNL